MVYEAVNIQKAAALFEGWEETLIYSCCQGIMGRLYVTDPESPESACAAVGCFAFYAGRPDPELLAHPTTDFRILVPQNPVWERQIEGSFPQARRVTRYATKKDTRFDTARLQQIAESLPDGYAIRPIDQTLYDCCRSQPLTADFVAAFESKEAYCRDGLGFVVQHGERIVAGASSYTRYRQGIEIEVDTAAEERQKGLAAAACARLILECLSRGLYPSWDAQNRISLRLAEKLGYRFSHTYTAYEVFV